MNTKKSETSTGSAVKTTSKDEGGEEDKSKKREETPQSTPQQAEIDRVLATGRRPFEVILKGGTPWGFALNGGKGTDMPLHISKIVHGGKASDSALVERDYILKINDVPCTDVGQALDTVDTALDTLTITVLRGHWEPSASPSKPQSYLQRAYDLQRKERPGGRHSDDSVVYSESKSSQAVTMRPHKRRGESFSFGKLSNRHSDSKGGLSRGHQSPLDPPWSAGEPRRSFNKENNSSSGRYHDNNRLSGSLSQKDSLASMNRRRSEGPHVHTSVPQSHKQPSLLSMKSSPNLAKSDTDGADGNARLPPGSPRDSGMMSSTMSSPDILDDLSRDPRTHNYGYSYHPHGVKPNDYHGSGRTYSADMYTSDMNPSRKDMRRSMPSHSLQRYQPDYENVSHLGTAPLRSEKISEIDDIDEVTGRDSNPASPDVKPYDPHSGIGPPTRDPASLKYIKVNQNHEKYPSWPVTKPSGSSEQTLPINSRAQSMTDHTNTSKEFPKKQKLAMSPALRTLAERNSPTGDRKADDGKSRNTSDPGFKTEFVYDRFGRVQKRNYENTDNRFEDFVKNSKPGYPPPNLDSDGHNYGDKEYNAPSPPERESKGVDRQELSHILGSMDDQKSYRTERVTNKGDSSPRAQQLSMSSRPLNSMQPNSISGQKARPTNLNIHNMGNVPMGQKPDKMDSGTSPLDKGSPLSKYVHREGWSGGQGDSSNSSSLQTRPQSAQNTYRQASSQQGWSDRALHSPNSQSSAMMRGRLTSQKDELSGSQRPSSHQEFSTQSGVSGGRDRSSSQTTAGSGDKKAYIVKSTPYYNTSTQTDMMPYAVKVSDPASVVASRLRHAEIQTSPKSPEDQRLFEEKSIQARDTKQHSGDYFKYPASGLPNTFQSSPFPGIQSIQAKYATDETPDSDSTNHRSVMSSLGDNSASILRKLSEEFYGSRSGGLLSEKRMSSASSQEMSPRFDPANPGTVQQPGMREAESYSSVVIHHDVKGGLFGRDDYGSVSSMADSRHDVSSVFSDASSNYRNLDSGSSRGRRSLDPAYLNQKSRFQQPDPKLSASTVGISHRREASAPVSGSNLMRASGTPQLSPGSGSKVHDLSIVSGAGSDVSSVPSNPKSSSSDPRSQSTSFGSNADSPLGTGGQVPPASVNATVSSGQGKPVSQGGAEDSARARLDSDSVFVGADDKDPDDLPAYEFNRNPSIRKAYGIYDETERLISQTLAASKDKQSSDSNTQTSGTTSGVGGYAAVSRPNRYSESTGLGLIQEEGDSGTAGEEASNTISTATTADGKPGGRREEKKYAWQNEAWLRSKIDIPKGSNLKRTTSEQIAMPKQMTTVKLSSYDTESVHAQRNSDPVNKQLPPSAAGFPTYENKHFPGPAPSDVTPLHSRTQSEDLTRPSNEADLKKFQQQAVLSFYQRKTSSNAPPTGPSSIKDHSSPDSSLYESIGNRSPSDSVADVIFKVNENLAKSAQRVDSIRRSNSSSSRNSSDYMEMSRERMRKETDWSRLRSSGSLRYSPDSERRSNRSSFASENHYEDISLFSPSTPRDSVAETKDIIVDPTDTDANMDSGLVASPTYQNLPSKRRPPPPPPRSPSPDAEPPALPPRKYRETLPASHASMPSNNAMMHDTSGPPVSPNEKNRITVIPLGKQQGEEPQVDSSKRDFKSLMTQWENNSPREDRYAAELRKQAQKFSGQQQQQQQQQVNAMPMTVKHSRTKINYATTYKREPTQPQEATSPTSSLSSSSSSLPSSAANNNVSTNISVSPLHSGASIPTSSSPSSTAASSSAYPPSSNTSGFRYHEGASPASNDSSTPTVINAVGSIPYIALSNTHHNQGYSSVSPATASSAHVNSVAPQLPERTFFKEDSRNRSSSDIVTNQPSVPSGASKGSPAASHHMLRDRSASDHDVLSDRRPRLQQQQLQETHFGAAPDVAPVAVTKWRPRREPEVPPPPSPHKRGQSAEDLSVGEGEFPPPPPELLQDGDNSENSSRSVGSDGFADESYIGHKNKSSRAIGTYKRSKSAAVLQTNINNNNYKIAGEADNTAFPEAKLGQQQWNSESVLSHTDASTTALSKPPSGVKDNALLHNDRIGTIPENGGETSAPPVRPARPSAHSRHGGGQASSSSSMSSSSSVSSTNPSSVSSTAPPASVFTAKPFVVDQPGWQVSRDSPRRQPPPPPATSPFDPQRSIDDLHKGQMNNVGAIPQSQYSPQRRNVPSDSSNTNSWLPHGNNSNYNSSSKPSPTSSSQDTPTNEPPVALPPRDYQRRESAPVRPTFPAGSPDGRLNIPEDTSSPSRRRSESSVTSTPRSDRNNSDSSSSHSRQPSQEELECDQKAKQLAQELTDKDKKLSDVLKLDANKKRMAYMDGLFSESTDMGSSVDKPPISPDSRQSHKHRSPQHSAQNSADMSEGNKRSSLPREYFVSPSKAVLEMELRNNEEASKDLTKDINDSNTLMKQKEELLEKLHKKLGVLKEAKEALQQEIEENNALGKQICQVVDSRCQSQSEKDKFNTYIDDLEKIVRLLLNLSGQLARAENAVQALSPNADAKVKKTTMDKREGLYARHEEAKLLKENIDKRNDTLSVMLRERLDENEFSDYAHFIKMKSKLTIELQELDDKITLGGEQIQELKKSIPDCKPGS